MEAMRAWREWWRKVHDEQTQFIDALPERHLKAAVVLASAAALFLEMVMVRWHGTCFHAFAIFKNVSLLSCFLGLGIGFGLSQRRTLHLAGVLPLLALQTFLFGVLSCTNLGGRRVNPIGEQLIMGTRGDLWSWIDAIEGNFFLAFVFILNAWMFIPLGQLAGRLMSRLPRVPSYSLNLLGSLLGIGAFFVLSLLWTGPEIWMGLGVLVLTPFLAGGKRLIAVGSASLAIMLVALGVISGTKPLTYYSPYQVIALGLPDTQNPVPTASVRVNHCYYQQIYDCSPAAVAKSEVNASAAEFYGLPYRLQPAPGDVLVVGSGTGNDVAAALRHGATTVTGVELDPAILKIGKLVHPERPYQDPRTKPVVNDARTYLRQTDERFDTIVYGLLDSHTNLGAMTNVRVDSFVYTVEAFREAVGRLKGDGLVIVSYTLLYPSQGEKLYGMLQAAYPDLPTRVFQLKSAHDGGTTFVAGPGLRRLPATIPGIVEKTDVYSRPAGTIDLATDDWPFFYMKARAYPFSYLIMIGVLLSLSAWLVRKQLGGVQTLSLSKGVYFFLGAGFMLIETKGVTELGLFFGNTWSVIAIVIGCILFMGYLANQWIWRMGPMKTPLAFTMLAASLLAGWGVTALVHQGVAIPLATITMPLALTAPLFFAGLIFSSNFAQTDDPGGALAANIFGAMFGGFLEYNSMYWGYASLYPLGIALYGSALACAWLARGRETQAADAATEPARLAA